MQVIKHLLFLSLLATIIDAAHVGLRNTGATCYMNTALQALASVPAITNVILSTNSQTLNGEKNRPVLLKLQTILYALRTGNANISRTYLYGFLQDFGAATGRLWANGRQEDESDFYFALLTFLSNHLPEATRTDLLALLQLSKTETTIPPRDTDGRKILESVLSIPGHLATITSLKDSMDIYFGAEELNVTNGTIIRQHWIHTPPPVLTLSLNRTQFIGAPKINHKITLPDKLNISAYKHKDAKWDISPEYELRYIAVHHGQTLNSRHYYGFRYDDAGHWIKLDDSSVQLSLDDVLVFTSEGQDTAHMLHYVNVDKKKDLFKVEATPQAVMTQINNELNNQRNESSSKTSNYGTDSSSSGGSSSGSSGSSGSGSSSSGSSGGSSSSSSSNSTPSPATPTPPAEQESTPASKDTPSEQKKFSWFDFGNDGTHLRPALHSLPLLATAIILTLA